MARMTKELKRASRMIRRAVREFQAKYGKDSITGGSFGISRPMRSDGKFHWACDNMDKPKVCALSALIIVYDDVDNIDDAFEAARHILGLKGQRGLDKTIAFVWGFDGADRTYYPYLPPWFDLGARLSKDLGLR